MGADTRKKIYDILKNKTGFRDSYEDFSSDLSNSEDARKKVFEVLRDRTGFTDSYDNFVKGISDSEPVEEVNQVTTVQAPSYTQKPETRERILNNIPDYFKSRGNDLSTLPIHENTMSAEKPSDVVGRISNDEQQRIQLAESAANDPYMSQQELEHVFKPKNQEQIDNVRQLINTARQQRVKERQQRVKSAGGGGLFSTMSQAYLAGEQNDTDKELEYASTLLDQAQNITNEAKKKGNTNFFAGFARGFKDAPLDGWAMGIQDLKNYSVAKKVMDKVDKGEELSPSEDALMQALVTNAATQMYYSGDLGRGYKAGGVTAESLPFMLDMIVGMGSVQAATKPAAKALVKYATEKSAKYGLGKASTGLAKGSARTVAGIGDVAAHTATFGSARLAADYQRRGLGDVQVKPNEDGTTSYGGRENIQTGAEAIAKSAISTAAETGTELLGEYFAPILGWVGKATGANRLGKIIPASVGKAYSSLVNSNGFKQVQEIASRAKIADPIGEYGEEVVNNLISTAIGDMTPEQLVDLDHNIDTFLGVAPVSVLFGAAGTGGYLREKYKNYRNMREFENEMRDTMGEDWSGVKEALQDADIETARGMVKDVLASDMQPDMKKKAINYISTVLQEQTLQEMDKQMQPEEMARNKRNILLNLNTTRNATGMSEDELNSAVNAINNEGEQVLPEIGYDQDSINRILDYKQAYDDYLNYTYWVQNQAYDARKQAEAQVQNLTNATTGTVMRVNAAFSKNPVNILRGNIVFDADGNVDRNNSDDTIYYLAEDGKVKMAPITSFDSIVDDSPADDVAQQAGNDAEEEVLQSEEAQINQPEPEVQPIEVGTTFQNDGVNYEVTQKTADGYIVSAMDADGNPIQSQLLTEEQVRNAISPVQETQEPEVQEEQPVQETTAQPEQQTQEQQTAISRIPVNENGEQDFESAPYQDTSAALIEISDNVDDAKDTATQMVNHYQEELKKAEKAKTTGNTIQEIVRLKQEKKENIQAINDKIAYWNSVANEIESKRPGGIIEQAKEESDANQQRLSEMTAEQQKAAQEEVQKKIDSGAYERKEPRKRARYVNEDNEMGTANTPIEHVLREIATGRVTFNWNDSGETQGLGSHLGLASSPEERRRMIWALSSDGMTPEAAAEQIHADMPETLQGMVTDQDVFNMILESFQQYGTPSKMWESAKSMHGTDIEESAPGYEDYMEQQALEWEASQNNMTVEEWISYCDYIEEELDNMYSSVSDEDLNAIFERFNEQIISENESRGNETEGAGSTEGQTDGEQGDELLPEGRGNNEGTDTTVNEQPEQANQTDGESGGVVPESEGAVKTEIESARKEVDQNPTEAQKEAGNYKKGHVKVDGFDITIENPKGSVRSGKDADGKEWSVTMNNDYGYIRGTEGVDGDHIDLFLSDNPEQGNVYVIDQINQKTGEYDESKVMYGFNSMEEAKEAYLSNFEEGWKVGVVSGVSKEEFRKWIGSSVRKTKPFSEYKSVNVEEAQNEGNRNRIVSNERYDELKKRLREKLGQLNAGIDPELIAIGAEMAVYHIERGAVKFAEYASAMIKDMGDAIRPYLKSFYSSARYMPEAVENGLSSKMTPDSEVSTFDVTNFDKKSVDIVEQINNVAKEQELKKNDQPQIEVKPESELSGDSAKYQKKSVQESEAVREIGVSIRERALIDVDGLDATPLNMKDVKNILNNYDMLSDMSATDMQELVELAMTNETRKVALRYINGEKQKFGYDLILSMYNMQPLLNARDSTRFERQQYSTPTPFGYVMGQFVNSGKKVGSVLEPSAGNGALTITFPAGIVHVNDIDERRVENLRTLGYGNVTTQDALIPFDGKVDAVVTNPPFGTTTAKEFDGGKLKISSLEGLMAINALDSMKDDGRAAIVIGGNTSYRDNGAMQSKDMKLFAYLYSHYNVVDVINLDGDMYKRNGTKYDVRIILINGRKRGPFKLTAPPVRKKARAEQVKTFDELYNRVQDDIRSIQQMGNLFDSAEGETRTTDGQGSGTDNNVSNQPESGKRRESVQGRDGIRPDNDMGSTGTAAVSERGNDGKSGTEGNAGTVDNENGPDAGSIATVQEQRGNDGGEDAGGLRSGNTVSDDSGNNTGRSRLSVNLGDEKVPYPNRSKSGTLMSVVPANQAQVLADSLANIGDVDQFLVDELGYSSKDELFSYLAAEQIDSVSLAINQMNKGNGFIIGDMTGVGKGRQGAALVRYAVRKGYKPIYFTQKPALFSDNYRDLSDIGSSNLRPFIIASDPKNAAITDASGNVVYKIPSDKEKKRVFDYILQNGTLPDEYDYVITTYSQINNGTKEYEATDNGITEKDKSYKKKSPSAADKSGQERRNVIAALSKNNIMILDESHTAGGSGGGSMFMQYIMPNVKGVTFLSATFAKRADNMPIYAMKTDLSKSGVSPQEMIDAISQGGVTLQEIMSKQLVQSGQMIRRERSFQGVTIDWMPVNEEEDAVQRKQFDEVSSIFSDIRAFQKDYITPLVSDISDELADEGGYSDLQRGTKELGVTNTPFASKMYNLVNQLLFSLKADAVANRVIYNLKNGFKPVISFTNTMEGFLDEAPKDTPMDKVPNFSLTLMKALDGVMRYSVDTLGGEKENKSFLVSELSEEGQQKYYEIKKKIENLSANLPISPMDAIKMKIEAEGYKVGEITGRNLEMVKDENGKYVIRNRKDKDKKTAARDFNNGKLDVLMINKSGSTGISLHASPKFEDQRQRVMVFAQFQSDINDEVQMRGRIDRTGQIYRGKYEYIMSSIPAEQRLQMMFKAKLKSLDANTTSSQKSKFNEMEVVDYLNKYGDEVTWQYMLEHPELSEKLGDPLNMLNQDGETTGEDDTDTSKKEGCAAKIARYLPFLPVSEQEEVFKEITDAYSVKIQLLNDAGENDLEITTMPLRAKTISKKIWKQGTEPDSGNAFADNTYLEEVEVDVLKKPMKASEIESTIKRMSEGEDFQIWRNRKIAEIESTYNNKIEVLKNRISESANERAEKAKKTYIEKSKEARRKGKNEFTDEEIDKMSEVVVEDILKKADESFTKQKNVIKSRRDNILKQVNSFTPLKPLVIPFNLDESMATLIPSRGMFLGFKFSKDFSPSSSTSVFATMDGRRKVEIPLNQDKAFHSIRMNTMMQPTFIKDVSLETWDSYVPTQSRKKAYIVTGNLLQALVDTMKTNNVRGYLVSYSTIDGETKQGILMSDSFKPENLTTSAPISSRLVQIQQGESVTSEDKRITVEKNTGWRTGYALKVPKSKKLGGEFFEDNKLRSLAENKEFTTRGNYMVADIPSDNLSEVLDRLSKMGVTVSKKAKLENVSDVRFREDERSIVDPLIQELMMRFQGEDTSRYPYVDVRKDPDADYEVYWGYSEPLYKGKNVMDSPEVPELIKDRIRNDEYEIDKRSIVDWLEGYIDFNVGYEEAEEGQKVLDWFKENMKDFKMSDKVNLIVEKGDFPDTIYRENGENSSFEGVESDVKDISEKMNIPVQVITSTDQITDPSVKSDIESGRKIKGWFSVSEGKVYVYLPNASGIEEIKQTILHEGVAHYGLRKLVGDERMDDFLDDVFNNVSSEVRKRIVDTLPRYGYDSRVATEEYMARMAENGVDVSVWERIKQAFKNLLRKIGINIKINDNELRYILWRSRNNLENGNVIDYAKDVAMQYQIGVGNYFREEESDGSREEYERSLQGWKYKAREAYQDSMLALKNLQDVIAKVSGKPIKSFEDAYTFENQLSSKNTYESEKYYDEFFVPLLNAEGKLIKKYGLTHKAIERYMMLAHGIERNVEMTFREQLNEIIKENPEDAQQFIQDFKDEKEKLRAKYSGYEYLKALSDYMGEVGDFSATEKILKSMDNEEHADFQADALDYVKDFESMYDVKELWEKTNNATKETLKKSYESGMMDKDHFANVSKMFMYYVPLRGWSEKTAEDVYEYINSERSPLNSVLKEMRGRINPPDEVIATIGNMAESAIMQGNRNMMKQSFMNMVVNHPTDVATLRKAWYVYNPVEDEWSISMPEIEENDTPEKIAEKIKNHDEKMKQLKEQGLATQKSKGLNIDYRIMKNNISQHAVIVKNGGKDYVVYVNGNPRAAQAVNGLTNPDAEKNPIFNAINRANRWLAANFTTRNPAFVMSNLSRDLIFSTTAVWIKEDAKYSSRFRKNILTALPTVVKGVMRKGKNSEADKYFREFVENGGETGYMYLHDVDAYKKKVRKELARITGERGSAKRAMDYTLERLKDFNRMAEDISRFAVYMTSRQMGRSIVESVRDAKEITVNFNKKGAGYKTGGFFGLTAGAMRNLYLFFNASVQSLTNFNRLRVKNPVKFYSALGGFMTAGMLIPVVNNLLYSMIGGGDDNTYNDLPEWVRRNNLCIYAGNGQFVTLPLPIELRAFYGLGDYAYQLTSGREKMSPSGLVKGTVSQLADLLPLNPTGNEGFKTFVPDALAPVFETYVWNEDFTGKPIAKLTPFNERDPEWKRVYKGTSGWLVDASKFFNDITNGGGPGSDFRKGVIDFNPAKVENLLESYFGGMAKFLNQSGKTIYYGAKSIAEGEMDDNLTARNVPVLNRFYNRVDDRNAFAGVNTDYFKLREEMKQFKYELNGVKKNYRNNPDEYRQMVNSDMFRKYMKFKPYQDLLDRLYKIGKETEGEERKQIEDKIIETRREVLQAVK